jgi:hypothetical protein
MSHAKETFKQIFERKKILLIFMALGILAFFIFLKSQQTSKKESAPLYQAESVDTYIPKGFVLVPLDILNIESVSSFIGDKGVIDLYETKDGRKSKKLAEKVRIIQAPLNPQVYAALVPENKSRLFVTDDQPLFAVVQSKSETQSTFTKPEQKKAEFSVVYDLESKR